HLVADDEGWRLGRPTLRGHQLVRLDARLVLPRVEARFPLLDVETKRLDVLLELALRAARRLTVPLVLRVEQLVVHLPELALLVRARRGVRRRPRVLVHGERVVVEPIADYTWLDEPL